MDSTSVYINSLIFSDQQSLNFNRNDIVIFVGANNSGKSVALKNIKEQSRNSKEIGIVVNNVSLQLEGSSDLLKEWIKRKCRKDNPNLETSYYSWMGAVIHPDNALNIWENSSNGIRDLSDFFIYHLTTDIRLTAANSPDNISVTTERLSHPIHYIQMDESIENKISNYFKKAFGKDLIVHRNAGRQVPLYCGDKPVPQQGQDRVSIEYIKTLERLPTLQTQGDGMRAFTSILLYSFIVEHTVVLIDEPEAFLHPPQARLLGQMLATETPDDRQIFIATHSGDLLRGILDKQNSRVRIIRIKREGDINRVTELNNQEIETLWRDPILRYSNILDGIFHSKVVICESDSDCRFYGAVYDAICESNSDNILKEDIMFIHCGGKDRLPVVAKSLHKLKVPISIICDFDVLNNETTVKSIYESVGGNWEEIKEYFNCIKKAIESKKSEKNTEEVTREIEDILSNVNTPTFPDDAVIKINKILKTSSPWSTAKQGGKRFIPSGDPTQAYNKLSQLLNEKGMFIVEVGELEGFVRSVGNHGPKWVNSVLEKDLIHEPELDEAKIFIKKVIQFTN